MTVYKFENNATGSLETAIGTGDVLITIGSGEGALFPSITTDEGFYAVITDGTNSEWVLCTSRSGDILTVTRASTSYSFAAASTISLRMHATTLESFFQKGSNRTVVVTPDGSLAANFTGEEVLDTVTSIWYKQTTGTTWKAMNS